MEDDYVVPKGPSGIPSQRKKKNPIVITFDEDARKDFVTGFRKRKNERRKVAQDQLEAKKRKEKSEARKERKRLLYEAHGGKKKTEEDDIEPDAENAEPEVEGVYDNEETKVTVLTQPIDGEEETQPQTKVQKREEDGEENEIPVNDQDAQEEEADENGGEKNQFATRKDRKGQFKQKKHFKSPWSKNKAKKQKKQQKKSSKQHRH